MTRYPSAPERLIAAIVHARIGADEWGEMLGTELRSLIAEVSQQLRQDLREGKISPNAKGILLGILIDKEAAIGGRNQMKQMNVSAEVSDFGPVSKEEIIARLTGHSFTPSPKPLLLQQVSGDSGPIH